MGVVLEEGGKMNRGFERTPCQGAGVVYLFWSDGAGKPKNEKRGWKAYIRRITRFLIQEVVGETRVPGPSLLC